MSGIYRELTKAQNECYNAKEHKLFDLLEYHMSYFINNELSKSEKLIILKFAKDVYKIAKLKNNLNPLV